jgi:RNA-directed DNA polymerase
MSLLPPIKVGKLQTALHTKAKNSPGYRFYALYDKLYRRDILKWAFIRCLRNGGAPGVDGQSFADIETYGEERWLDELTEELRSETYRPRPVRRVFIPKGDGKLRPLGIPICRSYCTSLQRRWGLIEGCLAQYWALFLWRNRLPRPSATGWLT